MHFIANTFDVLLSNVKLLYKKFSCSNISVIINYLHNFTHIFFKIILIYVSCYICGIFGCITEGYTCTYRYNRLLVRCIAYEQSVVCPALAFLCCSGLARHDYTQIRIIAFLKYNVSHAPVDRIPVCVRKIDRISH